MHVAAFLSGLRFLGSGDRGEAVPFCSFSYSIFFYTSVIRFSKTSFLNSLFPSATPKSVCNLTVSVFALFIVGLPADLAPYLLPTLFVLPVTAEILAFPLLGLAPARFTTLGGSLPVINRRSGPIATVRPLSIRSKIGLCFNG